MKKEEKATLYQLVNENNKLLWEILTVLKKSTTAVISGKDVILTLARKSKLKP